MSNPFDQFDPQGGNPFDQFDGPPNRRPQDPNEAPALGQDQHAGSSWGPILSAANAATLGAGPKIMAATQAVKQGVHEGKLWDSDAYSQSLDHYNQQAENYGELHPKADLAAKVVGGIPPAMAATAALAPALGTGLASAAGVGGVMGGGQSLITDGDPATAALETAKGAAIGLGGGVLAKGVGAVGNAIASKFNPAVVQPATKDFAAAAQHAYDASEASNTLVNAPALQRLAGTIRQTMYDAGFDPNLHPGGNTIVNRLNEFPAAAAPGAVPAGVTLKGIDGLRQIAGGMAGGTDAGGRLGRRIQGNIDDFLDTLHPTHDLIGGNSQQGVDALNEARGLWQIMSKSRALDEAGEAALDRTGGTGSGGNIANVTKQNATRLQNSRHDWTPGEQAALTDLIRGTPTSNALRLFGKLSPSGNGLALWHTLEAGGAAAAAGGHFLGGPIGAASAGLGAMAIPATGMIAKRASDRATARAAGALGEVIRNGGQAIPPVVNAGQALARGAVQPLSRAFMLGGVNASLGNAAPDSRQSDLNSVLNGTHPGLGAAFQ